MAPTGTYRISSAKGGYELRAGKESLGKLLLSSRHRANAEVRVGEAVLKLSRASFFRKHLTGSHSRHGDLRFNANLVTGTFDFAGHTYNWSPRNADWTSWVWQEPATHRAIRVRINYLGNGVVEAAGGLRNTEEKELALLGWYLVLLNHQAFGTHMLAAARLMLARRRAKAA